MGAKTDEFENAILNTMRAAGADLTKWTPYLGLFTATPGENAAGTEVTGGSYARQAITFGAPSAGTMSNSADITFPVATADWGIVTHVGILTASTSGTLRWYGALTSQKTINTDDQLKVLTGNLSITDD